MERGKSARGACAAEKATAEKEVGPRRDPLGGGAAVKRHAGPNFPSNFKEMLDGVTLSDLGGGL